AEHFARRCLVEANALRVEQADGLQHAGHADGGEFARQDRLLPARRHEAHRRQVVDLVRPDLLEHVNDGELIEQVGLVQLDLAVEVLNALEVFGTGAANDAVNLVALFQQQLGQVTSILAGDAGDQRDWHYYSPEGPGKGRLPCSCENT